MMDKFDVMEVNRIQVEAINDLNVQLKDLRFLLDECRPYMKEGETPAQCIRRNFEERADALHREKIALHFGQQLRQGMRDLLGDVK